jgi:hypothetical protein
LSQEILISSTPLKFSTPEQKYMWLIKFGVLVGFSILPMTKETDGFFSGELQNSTPQKLPEPHEDDDTSDHSLTAYP